MAILDFIKPKNVIQLSEHDNIGTFEFCPLEPGYGITIGNALRRVLLSSLQGYAVYAIKIDNVDHEFASIPGVVTDVANIILNLKQLRLKQRKNIKEDNEIVKLHIKNTDSFTAKDIGNALKYFEVLNNDIVIAETDTSADFTIELYINKGRGYVPADEAYNPNMPIGTLPIDSIYTPIKSVKYSIEPYRLEQRTDYEKLTIEVVTDGSISPHDALAEVANILILHFQLFTINNITEESKTKKKSTPQKNIDDNLSKSILDRKLQDMDMSSRTLKCLQQENIITVKDLISISRADLLKVRNFGRKSLNELDELLEKNGLAFGMDPSSL